MSSYKIIAKNSIFLYTRMFVIMGVTLYTARIVLEQLGASDFGTYSLVGGIVTALGFFNSAMSSATQRYLSFDIGKSDDKKLKKTFSSTLTIHFLIAIIVLVLAETIGLWYINNRMIFSQDKIYVVNIVYQFSILTFLLSIIQVPYNALIIARERMNIFAYVSIIEAFLKLVIVYFLVLSKNKLSFYSFLVFIVAFIICCIYVIYCRYIFKESKYKFNYDRKYFNELLRYSGWNLFGNFAAVARYQGVNIILNLFFGTIINASYAITMQVQNSVQLFVNNFQVAVNPQIIKLYAQDERESMIRLVFQSSKFSFLFMMLLIIPLFFNIDLFLKTWLGDVPFNTSLFCRYALIIVLVDSLSGALMTGTQATGNIKWYQIVVGGLIFLNLPISYLSLKYFDAKSEIVFIVSFFISVISLIFRLFFLKREVYFTFKRYLQDVVFPCCLIIVILVSVYRFLIYNELNSIVYFIVNLFIYIAVGLFLIFLIGLKRDEKRFFLKLFSKLN